MTDLTDLTDFYSPHRITLPFLAYGASYTIIPGRHNGIDIGRWGGTTPRVPSLLPGRVVRSLWSPVIGGVVTIDTGQPGALRHHSHCHLSRWDMLSVGAWVEQGGDVGKLANEDEAPGSLWGGIHDHFVISSHPDGAHLTGTGSDFVDPAIVARHVLAQPTAGSSTPFTPSPLEEVEIMRFLFITDSVDGNDIPGWALLNVLTGDVLTLRVSTPDAPAPEAQGIANSWARVWGDARRCTRQDMLNAIAALAGA